MRIIEDFKNVISIILKEKGNYLFLFFQIVYFTSLVRQFGTDEFLVSNIVGTFFLLVYSRRITNTDTINIITYILIYFVITILPALFFGYNLRLFLGYLGRIFLGILICLYLRKNFFEYFENLVFFLACISLPLFLIQIIYIQAFEIFAPISKMLLKDSRLFLGHGQLEGHRYLLVFLVNSWAEGRNSGFMWEPAGYAAMLNWAIVINVFRNRFNINNRLLVYILSILTTFSGGGYAYLLVFSLIYFFDKFDVKKFGYSLIFTITFLFTLSYSEVVKTGINRVLEKRVQEQSIVEEIQAGRYEHHRTSRIGGIFANLEILIKNPFGFGLRPNVEKEHNLMQTPNGLMKMLRNWGYSFLIILLVLTNNIIKALKTKFQVNLSFRNYTIIGLLLILPLIGNPFYNDPFLFAFFFSGTLFLYDFRKRHFQAIPV